MYKSNYIGIVLEELYRIFSILNMHYYDDQLPEPIITIQKGKSRNNLGWFSLDPIWISENDEDNKYEINISAEHLNRGIYDIIGIVQHEMVHYQNRLNNVKDVNNNRHNKKFKSLAEEKDLIVRSHKSYGWGVTGPSEKFIKYIDECIKPNKKCFLYFRQVTTDKKKKREKKIFKYVCPKCDEVAKAKLDVDIECGKCKCKFEFSDERPS